MCKGRIIISLVNLAFSFAKNLLEASEELTPTVVGQKARRKRGRMFWDWLMPSKASAEDAATCSSNTREHGAIYMSWIQFVSEHAKIKGRILNINSGSWVQTVSLSWMFTHFPLLAKCNHCTGEQRALSHPPQGAPGCSSMGEGLSFPQGLGSVQEGVLWLQPHSVLDLIENCLAALPQCFQMSLHCFHHLPIPFQVS